MGSNLKSSDFGAEEAWTVAGEGRFSDAAEKKQELRAKNFKSKIYRCFDGKWRAARKHPRLVLEAKAKVKSGATRETGILFLSYPVLTQG